MPIDDSAKMCCISKKLTSQQKYAVAAKTCRVNKMPVDDSTIRVLNILCILSFSFLVSK